MHRGQPRDTERERERERAREKERERWCVSVGGLNTKIREKNKCYMDINRIMGSYVQILYHLEGVQQESKNL